MANNAPAGAAPPQMFPLMLNVTKVPIFLIGSAAGLQSRLDTLVAYGATRLNIYVADGERIQVPEGVRIWHASPDLREFALVNPKLVFICHVDDEAAKRWQEMAHTVGAFVHVEDRIPLCDFHMPAILRHGHLQLTVSTDGVAPGVARILRNHLRDHVFGPEWAEHVNEVRVERDKWRGEGLSMAKLGAAISDLMRARGWLTPK